MKYLLFALILFYSMGSIAQADSTEIKLNRYKQLFMNGTINNREYEALRNKELGIDRAEKPIDYGKLIVHKKAGIGCLATGGALLVVGSAFISTAYNVSRGAAFMFTGIGCYGASIPFAIAGGVELHKYVKGKGRLNERQKILSFGLNGARLTF